MPYPSIIIKKNGLAAFNLLGRAMIVATFYRRNSRIFIVEATTPVEKRNRILEIKRMWIQTETTSVGTEGYLVYCGTNYSGWFSLKGLNDERFNKYKEELNGK